MTTKEVQGCDKQDAPLTLYHISVAGEPMPLGDGYIRLRCVIWRNTMLLFMA
jgi:hypothetical protein